MIHKVLPDIVTSNLYNLAICATSNYAFPPCNHKFGFGVCESVPTLYIRFFFVLLF